MRFELYKDHNKEFRWRLRAANGEVIAVSSESYRRKEDCQHGIELVQGSSGAELVEKEDR
jgi:uncharacterized protein YegP (UPF0339 family)